MSDELSLILGSLDQSIKFDGEEALDIIEEVIGEERRDEEQEVVATEDEPEVADDQGTQADEEVEVETVRPMPRRSGRETRVPVRFGDYVMKQTVPVKQYFGSSKTVHAPIPTPRHSHNSLSKAPIPTPRHSHNTLSKAPIPTPRHRKEKLSYRSDNQHDILGAMLSIQQDQCKLHDAILGMLKET